MMSTSTTWALPAVAACLLLAACGSAAPAAAPAVPRSVAPTASPAPSTATSASPAAAGAVITIAAFKYTLAGTVAPGATVTVHNKDSTAHTVTADAGGAFDVNAPGGGTTTFRAPTKPGAYRFHCSFHGNMAGTLTVA